MGRRTGVYPHADQSFMARILNALDVTAMELADMLDVPPSEIIQMIGPRRTMAGLDEDILWAKVAELVDERTGHLMAARLELSKALQKDRQRRVLRHALQLRRDKKSIKG